MSNKSFIQNALAWENEPFDTATQQATQQLKKENPEAFEDAFYKNLEFGTGGMRGTMGAGTNRINKYTLGRATQGLSNYLNKNVKKQLNGNSIISHRFILI